MQIGFLLLSGGKSSRMGCSKALLAWQGQTLLEHVAQAGEAFPEKILSANDESIPLPAGFVRVQDRFPCCGPLGGLHAALCTCQSDALVVAPCDAPFYTAALAQHLRASFSEELDALILTNPQGRMEPLFGVYAARCLPVMEEQLRAGVYKLRALLNRLNVRCMELPSGVSPQVFLNLNTPEDVAQARDVNTP